MGINPNALRFLARESQNGADLRRTVMIGRQGVHVPPSQIDRILNHEFQLGIPRAKIDSAHASGFAEDLLRLLGADEVDSFDYSDYEGASYVHDFNAPIPDCHKNQYTFLIDGGTLEHVFHFTVALRNCMEMLAVGGTYFAVSPANNEMGHGFYQISPELYFRAFSEPNGFRTDAVYLYEGRESTRWLKVADPNIIRRRAQKVNCRSTYLLVRATKTASVEVFARPPLQPDYVSVWAKPDKLTVSRQAETEASASARKPLWRKTAALLPYRLRHNVTVSRVWWREQVDRARIHLGINSDSNVYQWFDPRTE